MIKQRVYRVTLCLAILVAIFFIGVVIYEQQYSISSDFSELEEEIITLVCADEEVKIDKFRTLCNKTYGHYVIVYWMTSRDVDGFAVLKVGINGKYRLQKLNYQYYDLEENHKGVLDCSRISLGNRTVSVIYGRFFADPTNISVVNVHGQTLVDLDAPFFLEIMPEDVFRDSELLFYCEGLNVFISHDELGHIKWTKNKSYDVST